MINTLLSMSLASGAVLALCLTADRLLGIRLPARWNYRMLKAALFFLLVPVGRLALRLPASALGPVLPKTVPAPAGPALSPLPAAPQIPPVRMPETGEIALTPDAFRLLALLWGIGAAAAILWSLTSYLRFRRDVLSRNTPCNSPAAVTAFQSCRRSLGLLGQVSLMENPLAASPFTVGLLRPVVVIPPRLSLSPEELRCLFLHELTHVRAGDLWVKALSLLARCIHWYNPLARVLDRKIQEASEQGCDEQAAVSMGREERYAYGSVILKFASGEAVSGPWAASLSTKEAVERRLKRVLRVKKLKGKELFLVLALSAALLACGTAAALAAREPLSSRGLEAQGEDILPANPAEDPEGEVIPPTNPAEDPEGEDILPINPAEDPEGEDILPTNPAEAPESGDILLSKPAEAPKGEVDLSKAPADPGAMVGLLENPSDVPAGQDGGEAAVTVNGTPSEAFLRELREDFGLPQDAPVLFGNHDLIRSRGGTLLPDERLSSYSSSGGVIYKTFRGKDGIGYQEYFVGNTEAALASTGHHFTSAMLAKLVDGDYPRNSKGETYGAEPNAFYVGCQPDLIAAEGQGGVAGYVRESDMPGQAYLDAGDYAGYSAWLAEDPGPHAIPLYDSEGAVIGTFLAGGSGETVDTTGMTIDEAKAAMEVPPDSGHDPIG